VTHSRAVGPVGALLVLIGALALFAGIDGFKKEPANLTQGAAGIAVFVVFVALTALVSWLGKRDLTISSEGIETRSRRGRVVTIRWSELHDLYLRDIAVAGTSFRVLGTASVRTPDGRRIDVADVNIPNNPNHGLSDRVQRHSSAANWPRIKQRRAAGETLRFGPVELRPDALAIGLLTHPLSPPPTLGIVAGRLELRGAGKILTSKVWLRNVPNYPCLLAALSGRELTADS
jgi:uncharacterized protein DUF6585